MASTRNTLNGDSPPHLAPTPDCRFAPDEVSPANVPPNVVEPFDRPEKSRLIHFFRSLASAYSRLYHGLKIEQPCQIPSQGPVILVCNHTSGLDPPLIQTGCPRLIRWMMAQEYFDLRALSWLYKLVGAIPVQRTGRDTAATRAAIRVLEQGLVLGVFPEGKIETGPELLPFQLGIGLLALRTGAPVFPAYLDGKQRGREMLPAFALPASARIRFGPSVDLTNLDKTRHGVEQATARIFDAMAKLQKEHMDQL